MSAVYYTLILTRGAHTIDERSALAIKAALERGSPTVEIDMVLFRLNDEDQVRRTLLNTAHIVDLPGIKIERRHLQLRTDQVVGVAEDRSRIATQAAQGAPAGIIGLLGARRSRKKTRHEAHAEAVGGACTIIPLRQRTNERQGLRDA